VEVQALVSTTTAPMPRRSAQGLESSRLAMLLAVLDARAGLPLGDADVYTSVAGGVRVAEAGADLALALAVAGARLGVAVPDDLVAIGEIGLGGELRQAAQTPRRLGEAARLGFRRAVVPASTPDVEGITLLRVGSVVEALHAAGVRAGAD
jgi:DNA repair protein RadA/Sms